MNGKASPTSGGNANITWSSPCAGRGLVSDWLRSWRNSSCPNHYLQTTDAHFAKAIEEPKEKATQNQTQKPVETPCNDVQNDVAESQKGMSTDWANESHDLSISVVYKGVAADGPPPKLDQAYVDAAGKVIDQQLQRAGVRLAAILNDIWK